MEQCRSEAESLLFLNSKVLCTPYKLCFKVLRQSSLMSGVPIFITEREKCRFCQKSDFGRKVKRCCGLSKRIWNLAWQWNVKMM